MGLVLDSCCPHLGRLAPQFQVSTGVPPSPRRRVGTGSGVSVSQGLHNSFLFCVLEMVPPFPSLFSDSCQYVETLLIVIIVS